MEFLVGALLLKIFWAVLVLGLLLTVPVQSVSGTARPQARQANKYTVARHVAREWMEVGAEQYKRGFYNQAEKSFLQALDYQEYLTDIEQKKLKEFLKNTHTVVLERENILKTIRMAKELIERGELTQAEAYLEKIQSNEFLTGEERKLIAKELEKTKRLVKIQEFNKTVELKEPKELKQERLLNEQEECIAELYNRSVEFYRRGEFEKAREGFVKINKLLAQAAGLPETPEVKPSEVLAEVAVDVDTTGGRLLDAGEVAEKAEPQVIGRPERDVVVSAPAPKVSEPATNKSGSSKKLDRKKNLRRSYAKAIVGDAVTKVQNYISQGQFDKAQKAVQIAERTINKNRQNLGDELSIQYSEQLKLLTGRINRHRSDSAG